MGGSSLIGGLVALLNLPETLGKKLPENMEDALNLWFDKRLYIFLLMFQKDTYQFKNRSYDHQSAKKLTALAAFAIFNIGFTTWHYDLLS